MAKQKIGSRSKSGLAQKAQKNSASGKSQAPLLQTNTKQVGVINLLGRAQGTTISAIMKSTGWQQHSVRGFLAGVVRKNSVSLSNPRRKRELTAFIGSCRASRAARTTTAKPPDHGAATERFGVHLFGIPKRRGCLQPRRSTVRMAAAVSSRRAKDQSGSPNAWYRLPPSGAAAWRSRQGNNPQIENSGESTT